MGTVRMPPVDVPTVSAAQTSDKPDEDFIDAFNMQVR
jgi:hypothetical protein